MFEFDLQLFAESGEAVESAENAGATQSEESTKAEIPEELHGISEDIAREVMAEAESANAANESETGNEDAGDAVQDSENKTDTENPVKLPEQNIPYKRFKEVNDKKNDLEAQVQAYKARYGDLQGAGVTPQVQQVQQQIPQVQQMPPQQMPNVQQQPQVGSPFINLDENTTKQIEAAVVAQAQKMTGLKAEDVEALDYEESDNPNVTRWNTAVNLARSMVYSTIAAEIEKQRVQAANILQRHRSSQEQFNQFYNQQVAESDFETVKAYAIGEYFESRPEQEKALIAEAQGRYQRGTASPQDLYCIQQYWTSAKNAYRQKNPLQTAKPSGSNTAAVEKRIEKIKQAEKFPKAGNVEGVADPGSVTVAMLEEMVNTMPWNEIKPEYQKMLLGMQ